MGLVPRTVRRCFRLSALLWQRHMGDAQPTCPLCDGAILRLHPRPHAHAHTPVPTSARTPALRGRLLQDEDQQPLIAARGPAAAACAVAYEVLALIDDTLPLPGRARGSGGGGAGGAPGGLLYLGLPVPPLLLGPDVPSDPFLFLERDVSC